MQSVYDHNLRKIVNQVPLGFLVDARWLARQGMAPSAVLSYVKDGWLEELVPGVYRRPLPSGAETVHWETLVLSLYQIMGYSIHLGGDTALAIRGIEYYVPLNGRTHVWCYGAKFPEWISNISSGTRLMLRPNDLFDDPSIGLMGGTMSAIDQGVRGWAPRVSTPERALLESLNEIRTTVDYCDMDELFDLSWDLRPLRLQPLLNSCKSRKVLRLFCVFADRHDHAWTKEIDRHILNLGNEVLTAAEHGVVHPHYNMIVPEEYTKPFEAWH